MSKVRGMLFLLTRRYSGPLSNIKRSEIEESCFAKGCGEKGLGRRRGSFTGGLVTTNGG